MKTCSKCKKEKEASDFYKDAGRKDKLTPQCKECMRNGINLENKKYYHKYYYNTNKKKIRNSQKEYNGQYYMSKAPYNSKSKKIKYLHLYEEVRESTNNNIECKCAYCGEWFEPTRRQIFGRMESIIGVQQGENRLYCSDKCKRNCPIFYQMLYPKDQKPATSREVQPELRQMVFARDKYTCQKCDTHRDNLEVGIHCHHKEGIKWEPLQSADIDMCVTLCEDCHKEVHGIDGCGYQDMKCA